jgi:hypothetical protein
MVEKERKAVLADLSSKNPDTRDRFYEAAVSDENFFGKIFNLEFETKFHPK